MNDERFTVTEDHLALLSHARVSWDHAEIGAPQIDPKRPYGNSDVYGDMREILGDRSLLELNRIHGETKTVLQIMVYNLGAKVGTYERDKYDINWTFIG